MTLSITPEQFQALAAIRAEPGEAWERQFRRVMGMVTGISLLSYLRTVPNAQIRFVKAE